MKTETIIIHYSVQNGGDGSAYPAFMSSAKLAEWDQDHMDEGWGESCDGTLEIEVQPNGYVGSRDVVTELGYLVDHWLGEYKYGGWDLLDEFKADFFPDGTPELTVKMDPEVNDAYYFVCCGDAVVAKSSHTIPMVTPLQQKKAVLHWKKPSNPSNTRRYDSCSRLIG